MDTAYNGSMPYSCAGYVLAGCPDHQVKTLEQQSCAWMEGWATFLTSITLEDLASKLRFWGH